MRVEPISVRGRRGKFQAMGTFRLMREQGMTVTVEEIKSMLFMLSQSDDHDRGTKWEESLSLVKEAEDRDFVLPLKCYAGGEASLCW